MRTPFSSLFTTLFALAVWIAPAADAIGQPTGAALLVRLQNDAAVAPDVVVKVKAEVGRLFDLIGVRVEWIAGIPEGSDCPRVVSLTRWEPSRTTQHASLAFTLVGPEKAGCRATFRRSRGAGLRENSRLRFTTCWLPRLPTSWGTCCFRAGRTPATG